MISSGKVVWKYTEKIIIKIINLIIVISELLKEPLNVLIIMIKKIKKYNPFSPLINCDDKFAINIKGIANKNRIIIKGKDLNVNARIVYVNIINNFERGSNLCKTVFLWRKENVFANSNDILKLNPPTV